MSRADDLTAVLEDLGVDVHKQSGDEINGACPVHELLKGRASQGYHWYINVDSGLWQCFTCGGRGNLQYLVSLLTGDTAAISSVNRYLIENAMERAMSAGDEEEEVLVPEVDWAAYAAFEPLPSRICNLRNLDPEVARRFGVRWDPAVKAMVLPILSPQGELMGWQAKKQGWVRNQPVGVHKGDTLFGIERARETTAILLESPLDVVRFHSVIDSGVSAVSSFGANMSKAQIDLLVEHFDKLIIALDNDAAGVDETNMLLGWGGTPRQRRRRRLPTFRKGLRYWDYTGQNVKDLGEMSDTQIIEGLRNVKDFI
jgi:hypothetical protein